MSSNSISFIDCVLEEMSFNNISLSTEKRMRMRSEKNVRSTKVQAINITGETNAMSVNKTISEYIVNKEKVTLK